MRKFLILVFILILMSVICSCNTSRHTDYSNRYLDKIDSLSLQTDSSLSQLEIAVNRSVNSLREWWLKRESEKRVIHYSPPDSTGRQYKTAEETYRETARVDNREVIQDSTTIQISHLEEKIRQLEERINSLQEGETSFQEDKKSHPPWAQYIIGILVVGVLFTYFKPRYA